MGRLQDSLKDFSARFSDIDEFSVNVFKSGRSAIALAAVQIATGSCADAVSRVQDWIE